MQKDNFLDLVEKIRYQAVYTDQHAIFPEQEFEWIRHSGLLSEAICRDKMMFRKGYSPELVQILKMLGSASLPVARIVEGHLNALQLISMFGTELQRHYYFSSVFDNKLFSVWNTEGSDGVTITDLGKGKYRLTGSKAFCSGAGWIQQPLITGRLISPQSNGWQMCILPPEQLNNIKVCSSSWKPLGMRASASFNMDFSGITISRKDLLGPCDAYYRQPYFSAGSLRFSAAQLGAAQALLAHTQQSLKKSGRINDALQKARIAEIAGLVETGNLWVKQAACHTDSWHGNPVLQDALIAYTNMVRTVVDQVCVKCMQLAERSVGVSALLKPHPIERIHRDLTVYLKQAAPDAALFTVADYLFGLDNTNRMWEDAGGVI